MELDARLLGKPPRFGGSETEWADWSFQARAYMDLLDNEIADALDQAEAAGRAVPLHTLRAELQESSRKVYFVMAMLLHGPPLLLLRSVERGNGFEAWRRLRERYESATASRLHAMLQGILRPEQFGEKAAEFEIHLQEWEQKISKWETMADDILNDSVKRQILLEMSPPSVRMQLTMQAHPSYQALKTALMSYLMNTRDWNETSKQRGGSSSGAAPMEVDALTAPSGKKVREDRECYNCGKKGHLARDCRSSAKGKHQDKSGGKGKTKKGKKGKGKGKQKGKKDGTEQSVNACDGWEAAAGADSWWEPEAESAWGQWDPAYASEQQASPWPAPPGSATSPPAGAVSAIGAVGAVGADKGFGWILLVEKISEEYDMNEVCGMSEKKPVVLRTASGEPLDHFGTAQVKLTVPGISGIATMKFEVVNVHSPILSVAALADNGHRVSFAYQSATLHTARGDVPLVRMRGLWFLPVVLEGRPGKQYILVDSGASCHVCPPSFARPQDMTVAPVEVEAPPPGEDVAQPGPEAVRQDESLAEAAKQPNQPTAEEVARHELTHLPAKAWCEVCTRGRGRDAAHQDGHGHTIDDVLPVIQLDYGYLTAEEDEATAVLFAVDRSSTNVFATACSKKGPTDLYAVASFASWIRELGHHRLILQTDGEPALMALSHAVRDRVIADGRAQQVTCQVSPVGSHQSNGGAERAVQTVRGIARVYLEQVKERTGITFDPKSCWWSWALRHAAWVYNRFHVRKDTRQTPYSKIRMRNYAQPVLPFGELVLARRPGAHLWKSQTQFVYGCWLGRDAHTDEHIVGSKAGVFRTRAVRRLVADRAWSPEAVQDMQWTPWHTAVVTRGRPPKAAASAEPIITAPLPNLPEAFRPQPAAGRGAAGAAPAAVGLGAAPAAGAGQPAPQAAAAPAGELKRKPATAEPATPQPAAKPRVEESTSSSSGGPMHFGIAPPPPRMQTTRPPPTPGVQDTPPLPGKKARAEATDIEISAVTEVCEMPEPETWAQLAASSSVWGERRRAARHVHLELLKKHVVYEELPVPRDVKPLSARWVEQDDFSTAAKARLTVRGYEQALTGDEQHYSATPNPASLRTLLVMAHTLGLAVAVGDCAQAFLQAPLMEKEAVWVWPPSEAGAAAGTAWKLRKTLPGLKGGPCAWGHHATQKKQDLYGLKPSAWDPCVHAAPEKQLWILRHMDDYLMIGPRSDLQKLTADMADTMLLRDVKFLEVGEAPVQFLGLMMGRTAEGFDLAPNAKLIDAIVGDAGLGHSTRKATTAGVKEKVVDETPLDAIEHILFRTQVGRLLFLVVVRADMQFAVVQLARQGAHPTVSDNIALKRLIRYLSGTREFTLSLRPKGRLHIEAVADSDWAGRADRRSTSGGVLLLSGAVVLSWSRTQGAFALSSCEAELYSMGSAAVEALWLAGFLTEQGLLKEPPVIVGDSSSALQLASRVGQGRLKHVEVRLLALQHWHGQGRLRLRKVATADNVADILTKHVPRAILDKLLPYLGLGAR